MTPEYVVMGLGLILVLWYFIFATYNRRRGIRIFRWLQRDFSKLGDSKNIKSGWIGSSGSGAQIVVQPARPPFHRLELLYLLQSRELAPLWLINILRGKRDLMIVRAVLPRPAGGEVEVMPPNNRALNKMRQETAAPWTFADGPHGLTIVHRGASAEQVKWLKPFLDKYGLELRRLSWGPKEPHLLIVLRLGQFLNDNAAAFFRDLRQAAGGR